MRPLSWGGGLQTEKIQIKQLKSSFEEYLNYPKRLTFRFKSWCYHLLELVSIRIKRLRHKHNLAGFCIVKIALSEYPI